MNAVLKELLYNIPDFKVSLSITGTLIDQLEAWAPDVLEDFKEDEEREEEPETKEKLSVPPLAIEESKPIPNCIEASSNGVFPVLNK